MSSRFLVVIYVVITCALFSSISLASDSVDVMDAIRKFEGRRKCLSVPIGDFAVNHPNWNATGNRIPVEVFEQIKAWASIGLVSLQVQQLPLSTAMLSGIDANIRVSPTPYGLSVNKESSCAGGTPSSKYLRAYTVSSEVIRVISNEEVKKGVETYRVVRTISKNNWTNVGRQLRRAYGLDIQEQSKFIILMKRDAFSGEWKFVTEDGTAVDAEFTTHYVDSYLR